MKRIAYLLIVLVLLISCGNPYDNVHMSQSLSEVPEKVKTISLSYPTKNTIIRYTPDNTKVTDKSKIYKDPIILPEVGTNLVIRAAVFDKETNKKTLPEVNKSFHRVKIFATNKNIKAEIDKEIKSQGNNANLNVIGVVRVTSLRELFYNKESFSGNVSLWDTSNASDFTGIFQGAKSFDGDISKWNTSKAIYMSRMFKECTKFNCDISKWDVSNVEEMTSMFHGAEKFNQDISKWNVGNVENMNFMFHKAKAFNIDLKKWDFSKVKAMRNMFSYATAYNKDMSDWNCNNVSFHKEFSANSSISESNLPNLFKAPTSTVNGKYQATTTNLSTLIYDKSIPLNKINTSKVTSMAYLFFLDKTMNYDGIDDWDVSNVTDMNYMFNHSNFNHDIGRWNVANVKNMKGMFEFNTDFNQNLSSWDVSKCKNFSGMFSGASSLNQDFSSWKIYTKYIYNMFVGTKVTKVPQYF